MRESTCCEGGAGPLAPPLPSDWSPPELMSESPPMSTPGQKPRPAPVSTTTRTLVSELARAKADQSAGNMRPVSAFICSGPARVTEQ